MADTAHSDPYAIFMRKIGYSVGLEHTLERLSDLEKRYVSGKDITLASWKELGAKSWGLKTDNIADVFFSLRFVQRRAGDVLVLENLDSMAIVCELLTDEAKKETARAFIFLWALLVNDGEIFVNMLLADFNDQKIKKKLSAMIAHKRVVLAQVLGGKASMKRISRAVTIERQEKNKGSAGVGKSVASLKRTEPLQRKIVFERDETIQGMTRFSEDYFRKVPPRRKDWARSLGLWKDDVGLTRKGLEFKRSLTRSEYINREEFFTFWPMDYELVRAGFRPDLFPNTKSLWKTLVDFGKAYAGLKIQPLCSLEPIVIVNHIKRMMEVFRSLHVRKSMLRRELAITIAYPATVALACAHDEEIPDLPEAIAAEQKREQRRIVFRRSRNTGGALSLKR